MEKASSKFYEKIKNTSFKHMSMAPSSPSNVAVAHLEKLIADIQQQSPKTLAVWRLGNKKLVDALRGFAAAADGAEADGEHGERRLLDAVFALFRDQLNPLLAEQEGRSPGGVASSPPVPKGRPADDSSAAQEISVVFGGKFPAAGRPAAISEALVAKLVPRSSRVLTVSRSSVDASLLPSNVTHFVRKQLDSGDAAFVEFASVMQEAISPRGNDDVRTVAFYFTLGQHKGHNPFVRNIEGAQNFCRALEHTISAWRRPVVQGGMGGTAKKAFRVVLTGTDATLPSTHPDGTITPDGGGEYVVPSYKIGAGNYVYAASKLCQYYLVFHTVAKLSGRADGLADETWQYAQKLRSYVFGRGGDGAYRPETASIRREELDDMSRRAIELSDRLSGVVSLRIATGISICYTPLHAVPWTHAAMKRDSPRGDIIEQIVKRLKNAISIDRAAGCHFPLIIERRKIL